MNKISNGAELLTLRSQLLQMNAEKERKIRVIVHLGTCGISSGAKTILEAFNQAVESGKLTDVLVSRGTCIGLCGREPVVTVIHPGNNKTIYHSLNTEKVKRIVEEDLIDGKPVLEYRADTESPRFKLQEIRILHNQDIDPLHIEEYIARDGYQALSRVLTSMNPEGILDEIKKAGLRGRGGAGFPTATKWGFVRSAKGAEKYVVCNGDEGDPGAYMNRAVLEGNPHAVIEGMLIGAYAIGNVKRGYIYVRAEYPLAILTLQHAIDQAKEKGLLGSNILGTDFNFDLEIFPGAGAFVCGEETALLISIEGQRGSPRQRPPFPANQGLYGKPTTLNNVETWANVPQIILNGHAWFSSVGSAASKGTKTLCLVGKVKNSGLFEVPLGTTLGEIIYKLGEGIQNDKKFKGIQLGGPSGGVIPTEHLNTPVDYDSIPSLGAIMGSGGLVVMDEDSCMVDVAKYFLEFTKDESCGQCISCREGTAKMYDLLSKISEGKATMEDLKTLEELTAIVKSASICGLGQTAPNPVLTTLRYFRDEYEAHILDKHCPSAVCQKLFKSPCQHICPVGLNIPGYISLIKAGKYEDAYSMIMQKMPFALSVGRVCPAFCQTKCRRSQVDESVFIRHLKRFAADYAFEHGFSYKPKVKSPKAESIAIIGSGPAGLSAAWDLAVEGYIVTVFEALPVAGGMLAVGIPEYRLPKKLLNREIAGIKDLGIKIELNSRITNIDNLLNDGFNAVLIAVGAHKALSLKIPGEDLSGVIKAIDYLREVNLNSRIKTGNKVAIIGGGNSAIDAARVSLRKGAQEVHIIYRREKPDMPAEADEIKATEEEGIRIHYLTSPVRIMGQDGKVKGVECVKMSPAAFDKSGRRTPKPIKDSEYTLEIDTLIEAVGQAPDTGWLSEDSVTLNNNGTIIANKRTLVTERQGVFVCGDAFLGPSTVIEAIASGQRAASSIRRYLIGEDLQPTIYRNGYKPIAYSSDPPPEADTKEKKHVAITEMPVAERNHCFKEVVKSYLPEEAKLEASRCLRCDLDSSESELTC